MSDFWLSMFVDFYKDQNYDLPESTLELKSYLECILLENSDDPIARQLPELVDVIAEDLRVDRSNLDAPVVEYLYRDADGLEWRRLHLQSKSRTSATQPVEAILTEPLPR